MHAIPHVADSIPAWRSESEKRLRISMLVSATMIAVLLSVAKLPAPREVLPLLELVVELTSVEPQREPELLPPPATAPVEPVQPLEPAAPAEAPVTEAPPQPAPTTAEDGPTGTDWEAIRDEVIKAVFDALEREASYSVNPPFARARKEAAVKFRASLAPEAVNAWDRVHQDQVGRTILPLGDDGACYMVLNDPSVINRWAFENFQQNMVYCELFSRGSGGKDLPWVEIIRERYPYLRDPVELE
jgi:hypothetical protein